MTKRSRARTFCCAISAVLTFTAPASADGLPPAVLAALKRAQIPASNIAVVAQRQDQRLTRIEHEANKPMLPASVMKLLTTYAALDMLGPAFIWRTEMLSDAPFDSGTLKGNLYLKGGGDPKITLERFWLWLRELRSSGIHTIAGDVVLDQSLFELPPESIIDSDPLRAYNTEPRALLVNFNSMRLRLGNSGGPNIDIDVLPALPTLRLANRLQVKSGRCDAWRANLSSKLLGSAVNPTLELSGSFPRNCVDREMHLNVVPPEIYIGGLFKTLWRELGGKFEGVVRNGVAPKSARRLAGFDSEPLALVIRDINKFSNNLMARQLLLTLGARSANPATPQAGAEAIAKWLAARNLSMPELIIENGSGLSRRERISAERLARLLRDAYRHPLSAEFMSSLPLAGIDGTMKSRLLNTSAASYARVKTGALDNVRSMAGYITDRSQSVWIVIAMVNDPLAENAIPVFDALLLALREQGAMTPAQHN